MLWKLRAVKIDRISQFLIRVITVRDKISTKLALWDQGGLSGAAKAPPTQKCNVVHGSWHVGVRLAKQKC